MPFWTYMLQCADRSFYVGHTDDLETRLAQHDQGTLGGYTHGRRPVTLVWSNEFPTRYEALAAERQVKGWSRAKKLALIREDWSLISALAAGRKERASTSSARTEEGGPDLNPQTDRPEPVEGPYFFPLHLHPSSSCGSVRSLSVAAVRSQAGHFSLAFALAGNLSQLLIPPATHPARKDNLWQHTCFEAFVRSGEGEAYVELNFSPSTEWAAYAFAAYRWGMTDFEIPPPAIEGGVGSSLLLTAAVDLGSVLCPEAPWQVGLCAVIEEKNGTKSYWALAHPPGKADFHHPSSFVLELPPA